MADGTPPLVFVDLYQGQDKTRLDRVLRRARPQRWRWTALNGNNFRVLAVSSESYTNYCDLVAAVQQLFGSGSNVYMRQNDHGDELLRLAQK